MLALHLPPPYSCPSSTHTRERERERERERSREREEEGDTEKERKLSERATHTRTTERKQAFCASLPSLPPSAPLHVSPFLPRLSLSSHSRARTHTQSRTAGWEERGQRRVSSLSQHTHAAGGTSPPHVHADMLTHACLPCVIPPSPVFPAGTFI